jgi:hypothetical protein
MWDINRVIAFFREKLADFYTLPSRIMASRRRAKQLLDIAEKKGNAEAARQLAQIDSNLAVMLNRHGELQGKLAGVFAQLGQFGIKISGGGSSGLGVVPVVPVAVVAAASAVAIAVAAILADYAKQEKLLKQIEAGILTPEEAKALGAARPLLGIDLGKLAVPLVLAAVGILALPRLSRA